MSADDLARGGRELAKPLDQDTKANRAVAVAKALQPQVSNVETATRFVDVGEERAKKKTCVRDLFD